MHIYIYDIYIYVYMYMYIYFLLYVIYLNILYENYTYIGIYLYIIFNFCFTYYRLHVYIYTPLQNNLLPKTQKKNFLNMAPAEQCFILTWKKMSTPWGPFFSMLRFKVHMLGKSSGLPQK
jgi:hypothetical protein